RERARAEITAEILASARRQVDLDGAAGLSLRAVARDLGMVSSALYRYFPSRDALLTRLIVDAYDSLGAAAEEAESGLARDDFAGRLAAVFRAVRYWALANPNEYALIYGSPVPGYAAPADTVVPATRAALLLIQLLADAAAAGRLASPSGGGLSPGARAALVPVRGAFPAALPDELVHIGLMVWTGLFGVVSFELFGQLHDVVGDQPGERDAFFDQCVARWADQLGLA
ncbi:MAG TPA: TetR/AcrR family transcriptional regulator, partial [Acidimicrobiales bacterium]|nr:TetR/AcrR family transcriptional regulator [Acidimicrobiales bacterium]